MSVIFVNRVEENLDGLKSKLVSALQNVGTDSEADFDLLKEWENKLFGILKQLCPDVGSEHFDLVVFSVRKGWGIYRLMRQFLIERFKNEFPSISYENDIESKITTNAMVSVWLSMYDEGDVADLKVAVVDDSSINGYSLRNIVRDLYLNFGIGKSPDNNFNNGNLPDVDNKNIFVYALAFADNDKNRKAVVKNKNTICIGSIDGICKSFNVRWADKPTLVSEDNVKNLSKSIVEALALSSIPYVDFTCGFVFDQQDAENLLGDNFEPQGGLITQSDLDGDFADNSLYEFYNTTSTPLDNSQVESFALFPKKESRALDFLYALGIKDGEHALRIYVNRSLNTLMIVPYVDLKIVSNLTNGDYSFPSFLCNLFDRPTDSSIKNIAAYRLLIHSITFIWAKDFICKLTQDNTNSIKCKIIPMLGLHSALKFGDCTSYNSEDKHNKYFDWLNSDVICDDLEKVLKRIYSDSTNVVEYTYNNKIAYDAFNEAFDGCLPKDKLGNTTLIAAKVGSIFGELWKKREKEKTRNPNSDEIYAIPVQYFLKKIKEKGISETKSRALLFHLVDSGQINVSLQQLDSNGNICKFITTGEQACQDVYFRKPSFASFLQRIKNEKIEGIENILDRDRLAFISAKEEKIKEHFDILLAENKIDDCDYKFLFRQLNRFKEWLSLANQDRPFLIYCSEPTPNRFDASIFFFKPLFDEFKEFLKTKN